MTSFIMRFLLKKPIGQKYSKLCLLKKKPTFPLAFGKETPECFSAPQVLLVLAPDHLERLALRSQSGAINGKALS